MLYGLLPVRRTQVLQAATIRWVHAVRSFRPGGSVSPVSVAVFCTCSGSFRPLGLHELRLPGVLRSSGFPRFHRYYDASDSCPPELLRHCRGQVSPVHAHQLPDILPSTAPWPARMPSQATPRQARLCLPFLPKARASSSLVNSPVHEIESRSPFGCGLSFPLPRLPTPPYGDAVGFEYGAGEPLPRRGLAPLCWCALLGALARPVGPQLLGVGLLFRFIINSTGH